MPEGCLTDIAFERVLVVLSAIGVSYVIAHWLMERLAARFSIAGGLEYIALGWLLGPGLGVLGPDVVRDVRPVLLVGIGALGLLAGLELGRGALGPRPHRVFGAALAVTVATVACVCGPAAFLAMGWVAVPERPVAVGAVLAAGVVVLGTDGSTLRAAIAALHAEGFALRVGVAVARGVRGLSVVAFGVFFALLVPATTVVLREPTAALQAFAVQLGAGAALGVVFGLALPHRPDQRTLLVLIVGMVLVAGGFAYALGVSAIFVNFVTGVTLARTSRHAPTVRETIRATEQPFVIALYFFAGLEWVAGPAWMYLLVPVVLLLRALGRRLGGWLGARIAATPMTLGPATSAPGGLSLAFLLSIGLVFRDVPGVAWSYGPLLCALVLLEFRAPRTVRRWVVDQADALRDGERR